MKSMHLFSNDCRPGRLYHIPPVPHTVLWDVCYSCNQRCMFCYNPKANFKRHCPSTKTSIDILETLIEWGVKEIIYLGGEPLCHPGLPVLIHRADEANCSQRLISNGKYIDTPMAQLLAKHHVETGISLHGTNSTIHNELTQTPKSYESALKAIGALSNAGAKWYVQFTPTQLSNTLCTSIIELKKSFSSLSLVDINRLLPQGVGSASSHRIFLSDSGWWDCLKDIPSVKNLGVRVSVESVPHCWIYSMAQKSGLSSADVQSIISSIRPCFMGINQIALSDTGCFKICPGGLPFSESILTTEPVKLWRDSEILKERRKFKFLPPCCISYDQHKLCRHFYACGGGCKMSCPSNDDETQHQMRDPLIESASVTLSITDQEASN